MTTNTITSTERLAMIETYKSLSLLLINTDEDSKWDAIWDDMQSLKAEIDAATVIDENPNAKLDAEIASLKSRLNKALVALQTEDRVGSPAWENHFHNINSLKEDIEMLHAQRV